MGDEPIKEASRRARARRSSVTIDQSLGELAKGTVVQPRSAIPRRSWLIGLSAVTASACAPTTPSAFARLRDAQRSADALALRLSEAERANDQAVLAADAAAARGAGEQAGRMLALADRLCAELDAQLRELNEASGLDLLTRFRGELQAYATSVRGVLALAVLKTNERAQTLAFGPAHAVADDAVRTLEALDSPRCELTLAARSASLSLREREALLPMHIAEAADARMDAIEQRLRAAEARGQEALAALERAGGSPPALRDAFAEFAALEREILDLSRQNSDVRSRALSLGEQRALGRAAEATLHRLRAALDARSVPAHR